MIRAIACAMFELNLDPNKWTHKDEDTLGKQLVIDPDKLSAELKILKSCKDEITNVIFVSPITMFITFNIA